MINKIYDIVLNDPNVKVCEIVSISIERVGDILHTHLCMRKLCSRWVPRLLTIDQKLIRVATSKQNWHILTAIRKSFCADLWRWMKHGSTAMLRNHMKGQNSGLNMMKVHQSVRNVAIGWESYGGYYLFPNLRRWLCGWKREIYILPSKCYVLIFFVSCIV